MTKPRVLISDKMDPNAAKILEERGCQVDVITGETPEQLIARTFAGKAVLRIKGAPTQ